MDTFEQINTLEKAKQFFKPYTSYEDMPTRQMHLGQVPIPNHRKDTDETEEVWKYVIEECIEAKFSEIILKYLNIKYSQ